MLEEQFLLSETLKPRATEGEIEVDCVVLNRSCECRACQLTLLPRLGR